MKLKSALAGFLLAFTFVAWAPQLPPPDARQTACTAMAVKREAGGESLRGQRAVLDVLYARMYKHNLLPCQVIAQPGQFSFYQGRVVASKEDLQRLHRLATMRPVVAEATYFHTVDVSPEWAEKFQRLAVIGHHVFYKEKR